MRGLTLPTIHRIKVLLEESDWRKLKVVPRMLRSYDHSTGIRRIQGEDN